MGKESDEPSAKVSKLQSDIQEDRYAYLRIKQDPQPKVYTQMPKQPKEKKPGQLNKEQLKEFFDKVKRSSLADSSVRPPKTLPTPDHSTPKEDFSTASVSAAACRASAVGYLNTISCYNVGISGKGFVVVEDLLDKELLLKARKAVDKLVDDLANKLYDAGKITNKHEDKVFSDRLTHLDKEFPGAAVVLLKGGVLPEEFKNVWSDDKLLNIVEQLVGPEVAGHPLWNLRTKIPQNEELTVPWHQDNAYLEPRSLEVMQATAWIPLINANKNNGCMVVASGGHRKGITVDHQCCAGGTWYVEIPEAEMTKQLGIDMEKDLVVCEVPFGGALFLNNAIPHKSLQNFSDEIRYSLDLRWQRPDKDNGFYGMRDSVLMRTRKDPNYKIDWSAMDAPAAYKWQMDETEDDKLSPIVVGPWMHRWEIVHHNRHTKPASSYRTKWEKANS